MNTCLNGQWGEDFIPLQLHHRIEPLNSIAEIEQRDGICLCAEVNVTANNETKNLNVFKVTGSVRVVEQYAIITEVTDITNMTNVYADVWDGTLSVPLTKTPGNDFSGLSVGSIFTKNKDSTNVYSVNDSSTAAVLEADRKNIGHPFIVTQKNGIDTYIRFNFTTNTTLDFKMQVYFKYVLLDGSDINFA